MHDCLRNPDGTIGTPTPPREQGEVYCDACGGSGPPGTTDVYYPEGDYWERGVTCPMHNPRPHPLT